MIISRKKNGFTLIELITVIAIILILMGLLFPAMSSVREAAKKVQARNDIMNIVTAVKAYYTEYGQYPVDSTVSNNNDTFFGGSNTNDLLFNVLRSGSSTILNPRGIIFIEVPSVKTPSSPKSGIGTTTGAGQYYDPWGTPYLIVVDTNYDNLITNPYSANAGSNSVSTGVIVWSLGKDKDGAKNSTGGGDKNTGTYADDIISWQ